MSSNSWSRRFVAGAVLCGGALLFPQAAFADGPGTEWVQCYKDAGAQNEQCHTEGGYWNDRVCDLAYQLDLFGCDAELVDALIPIFN